MTYNSDNKKYDSIKIPDKKQQQDRGTVDVTQKIKYSDDNTNSESMYYEIDYDSSPYPGVGRIVLKSEKIEDSSNLLEKDEVRVLFGKMRDIARKHRSTYDFSRFFERRIHNEKAEILYEQAVFMQDFTDNYERIVPLTQYFPCYQMMGYEQLRTYFTWRTKLRQGNIEEISISYALLYIYELLANIKIETPAEGLEKLMEFWQSFRIHNNNIDKYVLLWLKDYHIYYELPHSFKEFVISNNLCKHYPQVLQTNSDFDLFCELSKYDIRKSTFYTDKTKQMTSDCFLFVIDKIRQAFTAAGLDFDAAIFRPTKKVNEWKPFSGALFHDYLEQKDRRIIISPNEIYNLKNRLWSFSNNIITEKGRQFISYVMKKTEASLRKITNFKYKLTANISMINEDTLKKLLELDIFTDKIVESAVLEYYREATKTLVSVDKKALERIRKEALITQEALIIEEQTEYISQATHSNPTSSAFVFADNTSENLIQPTSAANEWESLKNILSENEIRALALLLQNGDLKAFADKHSIMTEVLIDGINEKAMDCIGDNLIDEDFNIYEDYIEAAKTFNEVTFD